MFYGCPASQAAEDARSFDFSASGATYEDLFTE
jgi:hypothetical protein